MYFKAFFLKSLPKSCVHKSTRYASVGVKGIVNAKVIMVVFIKRVPQPCTIGKLRQVKANILAVAANKAGPAKNCKSQRFVYR